LLLTFSSTSGDGLNRHHPTQWAQNFGSAWLWSISAVAHHHPTRWAWNYDGLTVVKNKKRESPSHTVGLELEAWAGYLLAGRWFVSSRYALPSHAVGSEQNGTNHKEGVPCSSHSLTYFNPTQWAWEDGP